VRKSRRVISSVFVAAMLFAQFVIAAHACPVLMPAAGEADLAAAAAPESLPDHGSTAPFERGNPADAAPCAHMPPSAEPGSANLCAEHCNYGKHSDQNQSLTVPAMAMISLYLVQPPADPMLSAWHAAASTDSDPVTSPPHSILHCCLLI